jgi:hypothetical protein
VQSVGTDGTYEDHGQQAPGREGGFGLGLPTAREIARGCERRGADHLVSRRPGAIGCVPIAALRGASGIRVVRLVWRGRVLAPDEPGYPLQVPLKPTLTAPVDLAG